MHVEDGLASAASATVCAQRRVVRWQSVVDSSGAEDPLVDRNRKSGYVCIYREDSHGELLLLLYIPTADRGAILGDTLLYHAIDLQDLPEVLPVSGIWTGGTRCTDAAGDKWEWITYEDIGWEVASEYVSLGKGAIVDQRYQVSFLMRNRSLNYLY